VSAYFENLLSSSEVVCYSFDILLSGSAVVYHFFENLLFSSEVVRYYFDNQLSDPAVVSHSFDKPPFLIIIH